MTLFDVYSLYDIEITVGKGTHVYDSSGNGYLDLYGGHAVISAGHSHPRYVSALKAQLDRIGFYSNSVINTLQQEAALRIGELSGYGDYSLFMCNSGAEANENALKLASFHTGREKAIAFEGAFHGRTGGALAVTDNPSLSSPFNNTGSNVTFIKRWDMETLAEELATGQYCAVIIEGIQGVAGIVVPPDEVLREIREQCSRTGTVLILDEIQSGCGRTGKFFAHQHSGIKADIITMAKGIGNGFPVGAVIISPEIKARKGMLGTTFGGNHLACAAVISVMEIIRDENLMENAAATGEYLLSGLSKIKGISNVRGKGLMTGFEVGDPGLRKNLLFGKRIFTGAAGQNTIRLLPPLTLSKGEADEFLQALASLTM